MRTDDDPFKQGSGTLPRTELRIKNKDYGGSTVREISFDINIPSGVYHADVMQIFDTDFGKPCLQLRVNKNSATGTSQITYHGANGDGLKDYGALVTGVYGKWTTIRVRHDAGAGRIALYVNGALKDTINDRGRPSSEQHYFKVGVYTTINQETPARELKAIFRNIVVK